MKYLLADHLGSTTLSTDANGTVSASALYKAFGELRSTPSALGTDYKFTGQREEASLGLYFFVARWFDPSLGRFTSPDTIVPTSTQGTQAWDRYAFVNNNPVRYNDPTGHMLCEEVSEVTGQCYTTDEVTDGTMAADDKAASNNGCSDPKYCENGKPKEPKNPLDSIVEPPQKDDVTLPSPESEVDWGKYVGGVLLFELGLIIAISGAIFMVYAYGKLAATTAAAPETFGLSALLEIISGPADFAIATLITALGATLMYKGADLWLESGVPAMAITKMKSFIGNGSE